MSPEAEEMGGTVAVVLLSRVLLRCTISAVYRQEDQERLQCLWSFAFVSSGY